MVRQNETLEDYQERLDTIFDRVSEALGGENLDEVVLVAMRMVVAALDLMPSDARHAMTHVVKEHIRISEDDTLN